MPLKKDSAKIHLQSQKKNVIVSSVVGNYDKHPFFVKKAVSAKKLLDKVGLPKQLTQKNHA